MNFVLVHGAWHDSRCWQPLVPLLEARGHTVHTPDLPGHGEHRAELSSISLKVYSGYISQLVDNIKDNVVLVGHSMSGLVISQVAENLPGKVTRLVYLCAYLPVNGQSLFDLIAANRQEDEAPAPIEQAMRMSADKRLCTITPEVLRELFYNRCSEIEASKLPGQLPPQASLPFSGKVKLSSAGFGPMAKTYICCLADQVIPIKHQRRMLTRQRCDEMIQLDADHSPFLSCPQTLAAVLHSATLG